MKTIFVELLDDSRLFKENDILGSYLVILHYVVEY
jgi:hypothetical protein